MRMPVQRKHRAPPVLPRKEKLGDRIPGDGPHGQSLLHGGTHLGQGMLLQEPQHPDVFPRAVALPLVFQPAAQHAKALGQGPPGQRASVIQGAGLAFQQRQIMQRLKTDLLLLPDPLMSRHLLPLHIQPHLLPVAFHHHRTMRPLHRHRVVVAVKPHQRQRVDGGRHLAAGRKRRGRQRQKRRLIFWEQLGLGSFLPPQPAVPILHTLLPQGRIEFA